MLLWRVWLSTAYETFNTGQSRRTTGWLAPRAARAFCAVLLFHAALSFSYRLLFSPKQSFSFVL